MRSMKSAKSNGSKSGRSSAERWKSLREKAGLTQKEVSSALGYSTPQFISNVERGRCGFPVEKLGKLKKLYKLSVEQTVDLVMSEERQNLVKYLKTK